MPQFFSPRENGSRNAAPLDTLAARCAEIRRRAEVQNYDELIEAGVGEPFPILTLLVSGKEPEEKISEIDFGRAAVAAFFAEQPTRHAPPVDMANRPPPVLRVKLLSNTTVVEFRAYAPWGGTIFQPVHCL